MHPFFSITIEDIQSLTDIQSRELVARLCRAELRINGISPAAVTWGGDQRAKDGGVDVFVDIDPPRKINGYVQKNQTAFQVKAEKFSKGKIPAEMAPKGVLRSAIAELADNNGAYIIVSTKDNLAGSKRNESSLASRIQSMKNCLRQHGLEDKVSVDFYDCRKIADWVEEHPCIVNWIKHTLGKPIFGWQPYAPWAYNESDTEAPYFIDDQVKVFVPNTEEGIGVRSAINRLRMDLSKNVSVRIVGLSGVGKTRLVQALFDKRIDTEQPGLDAQNVFYTDLSDNPTPQPTAMLEALLAEDSDCVFIIDNCGQDIHRKLTELAKSPSSKIRLITIEYDIRDDLPEGTECYRLEGSSAEIIKDLLKCRHPFLSNHDLNKIADFSGGNARIAFALASTTEKGGELVRLRDDELFKRLFYQKNDENKELIKCAKVASLLYSFDVEDHSAGSEIAQLASLAEVTENTFYQHVVELLHRGLVQQRGQWRAVLPHSIANRLAIEAINFFPRDMLIQALFDHASDRIKRSFSRRLGYMHESKTVNEIVQKWLSPNGKFNDLSKLTDIDCQVFTNIAPVHEQSTLDAIERATFNPDFFSNENRNQIYFARTVRSLAYEPALFDQATATLIQFAIIEPENRNWDSTRDTLKSLFFCHFSGTKARSDQRAKVVENLLLSNDDKRKELGFILLEAALKTTNFAPTYGTDFGARKRDYGWWPKTDDDVKSWYKPFLKIAVDVGQNITTNGRKARTVLGESMHGLWANAGMGKEIISVANELKQIDGWPAGWLGTLQVLKWAKEEISSEPLEELHKLQQELAPKDLKTEIRAKVLRSGSFADELDEELDDPIVPYQMAEKIAEDLGKKAACNADLLFDLLPDMLSDSTFENVWNFGYGIGQETQNPEPLLARARDIIEHAQQGSVCLQFLQGVIAGVQPNKISTFLDKALFDNIWIKWFPELQLQVRLDDAGYKRLLKSLDLGNTPTWQYLNLNGRVTESLSVEQILTIVGKIKEKPDDGLFIAIKVLARVIHLVNKKNNAYQQDLASGCIVFLQKLDWSKIQIDYQHIHYETQSILRFALTSRGSESEILAILHDLFTHLKSEKCRFFFGQGKFLAPFFEVYPEKTLDAVYVADEDGHYYTAYRIVSLSIGDEQETAIREVPNDALIKWCEISPEDRYVFAAETCQLFQKKPSDQGDANTTLSLSEVAKSVFSGAYDKKEILEIFSNRFHPMSYDVKSLSTILKARLKLLSTLNPTSDKLLGIQIAQAEDSLRTKIAKIQADEDTNERARTGSFE